MLAECFLWFVAPLVLLKNWSRVEPLCLMVCAGTQGNISAEIWATSSLYFWSMTSRSWFWKNQGWRTRGAWYLSDHTCLWADFFLLKAPEPSQSTRDEKLTWCSVDDPPDPSNSTRACSSEMHLCFVRLHQAPLHMLESAMTKILPAATWISFNLCLSSPLLLF